MYPYRKRLKAYPIAIWFALNHAEVDAFHACSGLQQAPLRSPSVCQPLAPALSGRVCPNVRGCRELHFYHRSEKSSLNTASTSRPADISTKSGGSANPSGPAQTSNGALMTAQHDHSKSADTLSVAVMTAMIGLVFAGLISVSGPGAWRYYVAGGICAAFSHAITTPIDVVKTRQQVDPDLKEKGLIKSTLRIIRKEGMGSLLLGLGPTTFGYLFEGAVKFGIYEVLKPAVRNFLTWVSAAMSMPLDFKILGFIICGAVSGVAASAMLCPMEALRIRLVAEPDFAPGGWVEGGLKMLRHEGVGGLWKGMTAMMCKQVPYTVTKNVSFDFFTTLAYGAVTTWGFAMTANMKLIIPLISAMSASILSCISSQPGDMLLSVVNAHEGDQRTRDVTKEIMKVDGFGGFFRGIRARFLHVGLIVTVQLLIYDFVKRLCGIAATGSV